MVSLPAIYLEIFTLQTTNLLDEKNKKKGEAKMKKDLIKFYKSRSELIKEINENHDFTGDEEIEFADSLSDRPGTVLVGIILRLQKAKKEIARLPETEENLNKLKTIEHHLSLSVKDLSKIIKEENEKFDKM
jgi:hypothetical protein